MVDEGEELWIMVSVDSGRGGEDSRFLLYSTRTMVTEYMQELLERTINEHPYIAELDRSHVVDIRICWRMIPLGVKGSIPKEEVVRALHVECAKEYAVVVKEVLPDVYSANAKMFPGGIKLHFIPDIYSVVSQTLRVKVLHLCPQQMKFLKRVVKMTLYEITSLDQPFHDAMGHTASVWERLMEICSTECPYLSQFVNVAPQYKAWEWSSHLFLSWNPKLGVEWPASSRYEYGNGVEKFFNAEAWELHMDMEWNPETKAAVTPDDQRVKDIMEQDPEYQWEELNYGEDREKQKEEGKTWHPDPK
jgi:hypothetical protein